MRININADIGESYGKFTIGSDAELMSLIGSANIACGMHAGDPTIMVRTVGLATQHGVSVGAHPGFNDVWGFGRRQIRMNPRDLEYLITYQIGALQALAGAQGVTVTHVKPHGALNNMAHDDADYAMAVARGIKAADARLIFVANAGSEMTKAGHAMGLCVANESYIDRRYDDKGKMLSRDLEDSVIKDPQQAVQHVMRILDEKALVSVSGKRIPADVHTFCIHGDEPTAVPVARAVVDALKHAGIKITPLPELMQ